jgi:pseudaminic acid synthase
VAERREASPEPFVQIGSRLVGADYRPLVIAELSGNHNQSLDLALKLVDAAAAAGAGAVKLQTYTAETMTLDIAEGSFRIDNPASLWNGQTLHELYKLAFTPWEWHAQIFERCERAGVLAFSTPFDPSAVDFLESLHVPAYKIASFEITDLPLIRQVAATGKPVLISTGMASMAEIDDAVSAAREAGCRDLVLLKCTSTYPASPAGANLRTIPHLARTFGLPVGLSDHTMGMGVASGAVALGASVIEKHLCLDRTAGGVDAAFSAEPQELAQLVEEVGRAWEAAGAVHYGPTTAEVPSLRHRRSLYIVADLAAGDRLTRDNVRAIRPGDGLSPKYLDVVLGMRVTRNAHKGTPLAWDLVR